MTNKEINKIKEQYIGKRFFIVGDHPHAGERVRALDFNSIKGCKNPMLLVKNFKFRATHPVTVRTYRVEDLQNHLLVVN